MRAIVIDRFGGPEELTERAMPKPKAGPGEILVRVHAASVNPVDAKVRQSGSWAGIAFPAIPGYDASGTVEAVGPGAEGFETGDAVYYTAEIFGNSRGSYAEYNVVAAAIAARKPQGIGHEQAASVPLAGGTAYEAVIRRLAVRPGETILILGGAGGVGSFAVQMAKAAGARVFATAGAANLPVLEQLGADLGLDYAHHDVTAEVLQRTGGRGVDALFATAGGPVLFAALPAVRPFGRIATILGGTGDITPAYLRNQTIHGIFLQRERRRLEEMAVLLERGQVKPLVDAVLPLSRAADAHRRMDSGHGRGKIVLQVRDA